jgi:hypothetical protein
MLLVTYGGFGFHTVEVYQRFGAGTATFFFKVSLLLGNMQKPCLTIFLGHHDLRIALERYCLLQQALSTVNVYCANTKRLIDTMGSRNRTLHHPMERWQYRRWALDLPAARQKLELRGPWHMR